MVNVLTRAISCGANKEPIRAEQPHRPKPRPRHTVGKSSLPKINIPQKLDTAKPFATSAVTTIHPI